MHILKRGKVPSGEGAYFNIQNDDVTVSKIVDQIILFFKVQKFRYLIIMLWKFEDDKYIRSVDFRPLKKVRTSWDTLYTSMACLYWLFFLMKLFLLNESYAYLST